MSDPSDNLFAIDAEFSWFSEIIQRRFTDYFQPGELADGVFDLLPPEPEEGSEYCRFLGELSAKILLAHKEENTWLVLAHRALVLLALAPHLKPAILDVFFTRNKLYDRGFTEFGGLSNKQHGGFLPTGETALFLLAGGDLNRRVQLLALFDDDYFLATDNILQLRGQQVNEPFLSGLLTVSDECLTRLTTGDEYAPRYGSHFPAKKLTTSMTWDDLVLPPHLMNDLGEISTWMEHEDTIMEKMGLGKFIKPGFRALFYGPPGTGKTLVATLLGKPKEAPEAKSKDDAKTKLKEGPEVKSECKPERPVYRIDLSQIVSKYIGETEKNLAGLFARAEHKNWILFFDEADALFGKRTSTKGGNDRYANQEIAYLLQRIESYNGVVILASNLKGNIDDAFTRRFQSMLYFPIPGPEQRLRLWENTFGDHLPLADDVDFQQIARDYELAGGAIVNVVRYCALAALRGKHAGVVQKTDILEGVRRELRKEGKTG